MLVDEAETHLHYDAQPDLVDALMKERSARQVIYSTLSIGRLPPDLGCGIRAVEQTPQECSRVRNSYWTVEPAGAERVGYTPLLFAMGDRLLSLTVPRAGVLVEGPADTVLLPTLFRETTSLEVLPYRFAPRVADLLQAAIAELNFHAGEVTVLVDGDQGGREHRANSIATTTP